ncbi:LysE family translocator [Amaricoccus sp.]|uniref:LysE family translocator n=1 Tax=Amaricoccus sp. TaxID=1872485 RepID=UPI00261DD1A0|nr:LysE family translocator [uncultured Amaricoccus sp.]
MLPDPAVLGPFALAVVIISLTPGPDMTFFLGRALTQGRAAGVAALAGATTGVMIHTLLVAIGLSALIVAAPTVFFALKVVGALYLLWLSYQAIRHGSALNLPAGTGARGGLAQTWAAGVGINLLNPKVALFFMTFLPQFVAVDDPHATTQLLALGGIFVVIATVICLPMVLAAERFSRAMRSNPRVARGIDWLCASIFTTFAARLLLSRAH